MQKKSVLMQNNPLMQLFRTHVFAAATDMCVYKYSKSPDLYDIDRMHFN